MGLSLVAVLELVLVEAAVRVFGEEYKRLSSDILSSRNFGGKIIDTINDTVTINGNDNMSDEP